MTGLAIEAEGLSKRYMLGENTSRSQLWRAIQSLSTKWTPPGADHIWAIRDVSFKVEHGEAVGIIGRNGSGKSTLLKVLSRVTRPTMGRARVEGRMGTLLEVGIGFHPELTGRDNIFLNGTMLGMRHDEVARKFDEIVAFAELDQHMDTPVKRYSSGMSARLAFAIASFLEPEILIVDEVLAVGDAAFQRKSLDRLNESSTREGRTVLFVSHDMNAIRTFCRRVLVIDRGRITYDGPVGPGLEHYLRSIGRQLDIGNANLTDRLNRASGDVRMTRISPVKGNGDAAWTFQQGETATIRFEYEVVNPVPDLAFTLRLASALDQKPVTAIRQPLVSTPLQAGERGAFDLVLPELALRPGEFALQIFLTRVDDSVAYDVADANVNLPFLMVTSDSTDRYERQGVVSIRHQICALSRSLR